MARTGFASVTLPKLFDRFGNVTVENRRGFNVDWKSTDGRERLRRKGAGRPFPASMERLLAVLLCAKGKSMVIH